MSVSNDPSPVDIMLVQDPEFSLLASKAAIELDNLLLGEGSNLESVQQLAESLRNSLGAGASLVDAGTLGVFGQAIEASCPQAPVSVSQIVVEANRVAGLLSSSAESPGRPALESLRAFCVALSRAAASYRMTIGADLYDHPFRS
jgi:hypothetical protein